MIVKDVCRTIYVCVCVQRKPIKRRRPTTTNYYRLYTCKIIFIAHGAPAALLWQEKEETHRRHLME